VQQRTEDLPPENSIGQQPKQKGPAQSWAGLLSSFNGCCFFNKQVDMTSMFLKRSLIHPRHEMDDGEMHAHTAAG
jgi:hypothetical protein